MPRVTVIMAVFNNVKTIGKALESIYKQTYPDWELIICDDCSTDGTLDLLREYSKADSRITIIHNQLNQGPAYSRNRCIETAQGDYIAILDGDDYARHDRFQRQVDFLDHHPEIAFVGGNIVLFDENGIWGKRRFKPAPERRDFFNRMEFCHPAIIFRKNALLEVSCFRVAPETRRGQDADLLMRMYARGMKGYNLQEELLYYFEGKLSIERIPFRHRINSVLLRYQGYKAMGLLPLGFCYIFKPLLVGIIPKKILHSYKRKLYGLNAIIDK